MMKPISSDRFVVYYTKPMSMCCWQTAASQLQPGIQLEANLSNDNHLLILPRGHVFTTTTISKLRQIETERRTPFALLISAGESIDDAVAE
ncbi:hypothetical protein HHX48_15110 [Salinimonas sp. HHU 13199]|uniref:Uncharacterized protein n=1 Tax=Salinimonas profundi TaxID=2729140 RepID=A0ABR8LSJ0_9ALTE|nr:hypothetical protein [Salinimonas profundi]MBD3587074.1 hypothetical protein [Salinimonas profundi]